jgi:hypothetical protein
MTRKINLDLLAVKVSVSLINFQLIRAYADGDTGGKIRLFPKVRAFLFF